MSEKSTEKPLPLSHPKLEPVAEDLTNLGRIAARIELGHNPNSTLHAEIAAVKKVIHIIVAADALVQRIDDKKHPTETAFPRDGKQQLHVITDTERRKEQALMRSMRQAYTAISALDNLTKNPELKEAIIPIKTYLASETGINNPSR